MFIQFVHEGVESPELLEERITQELKEEHGDDAGHFIDLLGGEGYVRRLLTSN